MGIWVVYALASSATLGFNYVVGEIIYSRMHFATALVVANLTGAISMAAVAWQQGALSADLRTASSSDLWWLAAFSVAWTLVEVFIALAITNKNAVMATMIEVSYPLFTVLFSALLLGTRQLTPAVALGAVLVISGVTLIALKAP